MSDYKFVEAFATEVEKPIEAWDVYGGAAGGTSELFKQLGEIAAKIRSDALVLDDAVRTGALLQSFSNGLVELNTRLMSAYSTAASPDDLKFSQALKEFVRRSTLDVQNVTYALEEAAIGHPSALPRITASVSTAFKNVSAFLGLLQIADEFHKNGFTEVGIDQAGKKAFGIVVGMLGAEVAAALSVGALALLGAPALIVAAGAVGAAVFGGYFAGKAGEALWEPSRRWYEDVFLEGIFDASSHAVDTIKSSLSEVSLHIGKFDGTWLEGFSITAEEKAQFTTALVGMSKLPSSEHLDADINRLFRAPFNDADSLVSRDVLLRTVLFIAQDLGSYDSELVTVAGNTITLDLPPLSSMAVDELRSAVEKAIDSSGRTSFTLLEPKKVVVALSNGAINGADDDELIFGSEAGGQLAGNAGHDVIIGGGGGDILDGGEGSDTIVGGAGGDLVYGGEGGDYLYGGQGFDTYRFDGRFGGDWVADSDGQGEIIVDGIELKGGRKSSDGFYVDDVTGWAYQRNGTDLILLRDSSLNQIRIRNWQPGQLGITLDETQTTPATTGQHYAGDAGNNDWFGDTADDHLEGFGGNDGLSGKLGDDWIEGGSGDDLLLGGLGADTIEGGIGNDHIFGSPNWYFVDWDVPPPAYGPEIARGANWVIYETPGYHPYAFNLNGPYGGTSTPEGEVGNLIDGGEGNDRIGAGSAADVARGGEGDDTVVGMGGSDVLSGDAGDDVVTGDGIYGAFGWHTELSEHGNDVISGDAGNDHLDGQGGDDVLYGGADNDTIYGDAFDLEDTPLSIHGSDYLDGGDGNDSLHGGGAGDQIYGGAGADQLWGDSGALPTSSAGFIPGQYHGDDYLDGEAGEDYVQGEGGDDTLYGGTESDTLVGDAPESVLNGSFHGADYLDGEDGDDDLVGFGGNDTLYGGQGADWLDGDSFESQLGSNSHGADYLDGEGGDDQLIGRGSSDVLYGGIGNDTLEGDSSNATTAAQFHGDDFLDGEEGQDWLLGQGGADTLFGGEGADYLVGDDNPTEVPVAHHGNDWLVGEAGADTLVGGGGNDRLDGGADNDALSGDHSESVEGHGADTLDGGDGDDTLFGGGGNDVLYGSSGNDWIAGEDQSMTTASSSLSGDDYLDGGSGNDTLVGGNGADWLVGGAGADGLFGGAGSDKLAGGDGADQLFGGAGDDRIDGGADNDVLEGDLDASAEGHGADTLDGGAGDDGLFGGGGNDLLIGGSGNDWIAGEDQRTPQASSALSGDDTLEGGAGNDTLIGGNGNDLLNGGEGADALVGGAGIDTYVLQLDGSTDEVIDTDADSVFVIGSASSEVDIAQRWTGTTAGTGDEYLTIDAGASRIQIKNGTRFGTQVYRFADDVELTQEQLLDRITASLIIRGGTGAESMRGGSGADDISGGGGNDSLIGAAGADTLAGGTGNDMLEAGAGGGSVRGDEGNDTYRFGRGDGQLLIDNVASDWATANDVLSFGPNIGPNDISAKRVGYDLQMNVLGTSDSVVISNYYWRSDAYYRIKQVVFADGTTWSRATLESKVTPEGTAGNDALTGTAGNDVIHAGDGADWVWGNAGNDQLFGEAGNDNLDGGDGDDLLDGGVGTDTLIGGAGNDTLTGGERMSGGEGSDTYAVTTWPTSALAIIETSGHDVLTLPGTVAASDLKADVSLANDALSLRMGSGEILIEGYFASQAADSVEEIRFADGTVWSRADVFARLPSARLSDADDSAVYGFRWNDSLDGLGGNDRLDGRLGDDTLFGGAGRDTLYGSQGHDVLSGGAGDDTVYGDFGSSTSSNDGNDLLSGDEGKDELYGGGGSDTLDGGAGSDRIEGGDGDDRYRFDRNSGRDLLYDSAGNDRLEFGATVMPSSVTLLRDGTDLLVALDQTVAQTRVRGHFASASNTLESISFADGTIWDAAAIASRTVTGAANAMTGTAGNDTFVVDNTDDTISDTLGGVDTVQSAVTWTLGNNLENLTLTSYGDVNATGNALANVLTGNAGNNTLDGGAGIDTLVGGAGDDTYRIDTSSDAVIEQADQGIDTVISDGSYTLPDHVENLQVVTRSWARSDVRGNAADNVISLYNAYAGNRLDGGAGADTLIFSGGGSAVFYVDNLGDSIDLSGSTGSNYNVISSVNWTLGSKLTTLQLTGSATYGGGNSQNNILIGNGQHDALYGFGGDDVLYGNNGDLFTLPGGDAWTSWYSPGVDTLVGGTGDDTYYVYQGFTADVVIENAGEGNDTVIISDDRKRTYALTEFANVENLRLMNTLGSSLVGDAQSNTLSGDAASNLLDGGDGDDWLYDGGYYSSNGADTLLGGAGNDRLSSGDGNDVLVGGIGNDSLAVQSRLGITEIRFARGDGEDVVTHYDARGTRIVFGAGLSVADLSISREGHHLRLLLDHGDSITLGNYFADESVIAASGVLAQVEFVDGVVLSEQMLLSRMQGGNAPTSAADVLIGTRAADAISGGAGDDMLFGAEGDDTLSGGTGADQLHGGADSDTYRVASGDGLDTIVDTGGTADAVEFEAGIASNDIGVSRNGDDLRLLHVNGSDGITLSGFFAAASSEIEAVRFADGTVWTVAMLQEMSNRIIGTSGNDTISGRASTDQLFGLAGHDRLEGMDGDDLLDGGEGNDTLSGGGGADTLVGGSGNDLLDPGTEVDVIRFGRGAGNDTIAGYYGSGDIVEFGVGVVAGDLEFTLSGSNLVISITGTTDSLTVEGFVDFWNQVSLRFEDGTTWTSEQILGELTTVHGTEQADSIIGSAASDHIYAYGGNDIVDGQAGHDQIEGGNGNDTLTGGAGYDLLDGGLGADRMVGGADDDRYIVDNTGDVVVETGDGYDSIESSVTYTLPNYVERITLTGSESINATGNSLDNTIEGNAGHNNLIGGAGNDDIWDGDGNDTLNGGAGVDTMGGGLGDDTYVVDATADEVYEYELEGNDLVQSSVTYTLGEELERLTLTGTSGLSGTGNALDNVLTGNAGANRLEGLVGNDTIDGGSGTDTMIGGAGNDSYYVSVSSDVVTEAAGQGIDTVYSAVTLTLAANVENLTLTGTTALNGTGNALANHLVGNAGANSLTGGDGNDTVDGGAGNDTMVGGAGDDTYYVNASTDVVTESTNQGTDSVFSSATLTLGANVEKLTLTGTTAINGTGNALANTLVGNAAANSLIGGDGNDTLDGGDGNDTLDGGAGNDTMLGGAGDDTYYVNASTDVITESVSQGTDTVFSSVTLALGTNLENLTLTGTTAIDGTGNALANTLVGNTAANNLTGGDGNDTLDGGAGNDTMVGGTGDDSYHVNVSTDVITESVNQGTDTVFSAATLTLGANLENLTLTGTSALNGTGNALANTLVGNSAANTLTGGDGNDTLDGSTGNDTMVGGAGDDTYVLNVATDVVTEAASAGTDTVISAVTYTLGTNVENLVLSGSSAVNGIGTATANALTGNGGANTLTGNAGDDTLDGAAGNDVLAGGTGADVYRFGAGYGTDTIQENDATAGVTDAVQFIGSVTQSSVTFSRTGNNLEALLTGTSDRIVLQNWYAGAQYQVEQFRFTDGSVLTGAQAQAQVGAGAGAMASQAGSTTSARERAAMMPEVHLLVEAMAAFDASAGVGSPGPAVHHTMVLDRLTYPGMSA